MLAQTQSHYQTWQNAKRTLLAAQTQAEQIVIERERLEWQFNELAQLNLETGEWETLNQSHDSLANAAELLQAASEAQEWVSGDNGLQNRY